MEQKKSQCKKDGVTYSLISAPQASESVQHPCFLLPARSPADREGKNPAPARSLSSPHVPKPGNARKALLLLPLRLLPSSGISRNVR